METNELKMYKMEPGHHVGEIDSNTITVNQKPDYLKFSVNHILDKDNRTLQTHQGLIKISKIHSVFISPEADLGRLYINCEDNVNWSYLFERYDIAEQVMDRIKIALSAPKGHRQELVGVLKTETF